MAMADETRSTRSGASHWSVDTRLNVAHLLTTLSLVGGLFAYANAIDRRIAVLEEKAASQRERDIGQDSQASAALLLLRADIADLRGELREANRALQRYIEANRR